MPAIRFCIQSWYLVTINSIEEKMTNGHRTKGEIHFSVDG